MNEKNINIAWRIEDLSGKFVDVKDKIYPKILYYSSTRDPNDTDASPVIIEEYLTYKICDDETFANFNVHGGVFYCIDWNDKNFGGYWDSPFLYYFEIQLFFCPEGKPYSIDNNCTSMEELSSYFRSESNWFFSIYYPVYHFNPLDYDNPIDLSYQNYFYALSHTMQKTDRIFFKEIIMIDDKGIIFEIKNTKSLWAVDNFASDFAYYAESELQREEATSKFYGLNIYMDKTINHHNRSYKKLQEILAFIGSFFKVVFFVAEALLYFFNKTMKDKDLFNSFFSLKQPVQSSSSFSPIRHYHINNSLNSINNSAINLVNQTSKVNEVNISPTIRYVNNKQNCSMKSKQTRFSFWNIFLAEIKRSCCKYKENEFDKMYSCGNWIIYNFCDLNQYLNLYKDIYFVKNSIYTNEQINGINQIKKLNLKAHHNLIANLKSKHSQDATNKAIDYYSNLRRQAILTKTDEIILKFLYPYNK